MLRLLMRILARRFSVWLRRVLQVLVSSCFVIFSLMSVALVRCRCTVFLASWIISKGAICLF
ncbi:hypothetical protein [Microviridae sp.]|nr:hypothetical protein [Microviridae sp.]UOF78487.1 hypothetical protein [Microviridae sp.]